MANPLDLLGRALLRINGMTPQQIRQQTRANKPSKPMPKAKASKPAPKPTQVVGQTNLFSQSGKPRDFRNPNVSGNRPPTVTPVSTKGTATLNPKPTRPGNPDQLGLFDPKRLPPGSKGGSLAKTSAPLATQGRGPLGGQGSLPPGRRGGGLERSGPTIDVTANAPKVGAGKSSPAGGRAALAGGRAAAGNAGLASGFGGGLGMLATGLAVLDQAGKVFNPKDNLLTSLGDLGNTLSNGGRPGPGHSQYQTPQPRTSGPIGPQQTPQMVADYRAARDQRHAALRADMPAPTLRSPASAAPVHTPPRQFGSAFAPQANAPVKPNAPVASPQPQEPSNPYAGMGDVRGNAMGQGPAADSTFKAGDQQYGGQSLKGIGADGVDHERRRAFLDAKDSLSGMDAVRELLKRRKLTISASN